MNSKIYVFSDGIKTYAKSQKALEQEHGTENPVVAEQETNDVQLAYTLKSFTYLELLGKSDDQFYVVVDLSGQDKQNAFSNVAGDVDIFKSKKAIEAFDERGFEPDHCLYSYNDETIAMLKSLDSVKEVKWTRPAAQPDHSSGVKMLKLPQAQPDDISFIEHWITTK